MEEMKTGPAALRGYTTAEEGSPYCRNLPDDDLTEEEVDEAGEASCIPSVEDESDREDEDGPADDANTAQPRAPDISHTDFAQIQKKQAWLRGGGGGGTDISDTASTRSATRRKVQRPSLLEALFLPKTTAARAQPTTRRRSTAEVVRVRTPTAPSIKSAKSAKSETPPRKPARPISLFLSPTKPVTPVKYVTCTTCLADDIPRSRSAMLECKHRMCASCLKRIFTLSTTDPQLMPPKCCTENGIPLRHVEHLFDTKFKILWNRKFAEYTTKHRLYCPSKGCGEWIKPKYIEVDRATGRKRGTCKECKTKVCKKCGCKWHGIRECDNDDATKGIIELGKENGWQRCYNCRTMVQLAEGCNHMKCRCNAEFCMVCGLKWKTCDCPWFNLPPEIRGGVEGFLVPGLAFPPPPPPPPPGVRNRGWNFGMPPPPPPPPNPLPPLDLGDQTGDPGDLIDLLGSWPGTRHQRRRRPSPPEPPSPEDQEAADEELARRLQEQEIEDLGGDEDAASSHRRRVNRRARGLTREPRVYEIGEDAVLREVRLEES